MQSKTLRLAWLSQDSCNLIILPGETEARECPVCGHVAMSTAGMLMLGSSFPAFPIESPLVS